MDAPNREIPNVDRISLLPDAILCHILSFLSTKDVVATSVLSKRWRPLWLSVPILDVDLQRSYIEDEKSYACFARFLYATILARNPQQPLKRFTFELRFKTSLIWDRLRTGLLRSDVKIWLNTAVHRKLEHLHVNLSIGWILPASIFSCRTLVVLKLENCTVNNDFSSIDLPSLKILLLKSVQFAEYQFLGELLNGCPVLEDLKTNYATCWALCSTLLVEFKCLRKLVRDSVFGPFPCQIPLEDFCNAEFLRLEMEHLASIIPVFPNVTYLELSCSCRIKLHLLFEMLNHCPNLQIFSLRKVNSRFTDQLCPIPLVVPLCISSHLKKCSLVDFVGSECEMVFTKYVLQNSSALRTMNVQCKAYLNPLAKHERLKMMKELSEYPRSSTTCELLFE